MRQVGRLVKKCKQKRSEDHGWAVAGGLSQERQYTSPEKRFLKNWAKHKPQRQEFNDRHGRRALMAKAEIEGNP